MDKMCLLRKNIFQQDIRALNHLDMCVFVYQCHGTYNLSSFLKPGDCLKPALMVHKYKEFIIC